MPTATTAGVAGAGAYAAPGAKKPNSFAAVETKEADVPVVKR